MRIEYQAIYRFTCTTKTVDVPARIGSPLKALEWAKENAPAGATHVEIDKQTRERVGELVL